MGNQKSKKDKNDWRIKRIMEIFIKLRCGLVIRKAEEAEHYNASEKTIQRDIKIIRECLDVVALQEGIYYSIDIDNAKKGYHMHGTDEGLFSGGEAFVISKTLLAGNVLSKACVEQIFGKLLRFCVEREREKVKKSLQNELYYYIGAQTEEGFEEQLWELAQAAQARKLVEIDYLDEKGASKTVRDFRLVDVVISGNGFCLVGFRTKGERRLLPGVGEIPLILRIDRIVRWQILGEEGSAAKKERLDFEDFKQKFQDFLEKRLPETIELRCSEADAQCLLENFPEAEMVPAEDGIYIVYIKSGGNGLDWWLGR